MEKLTPIEALEMIALMAPPDDWEPWDSWSDWVGYEDVPRDDPAFVPHPDPSNTGDVFAVGAGRGRQQAAKIARRALAAAEENEK